MPFRNGNAILINVNPITKHYTRTTGKGIILDDEVRMTFYKNTRTFEGSLALNAKDSIPIKGIGDATKKGGDSVIVRLSTIITVLNDKFGANMAPEDQLLFDQIEGDMAKDEELRTQAINNDLANFSFPAKEKISGAFLERTEKNQSLFSRYLADEDFRNTVELIMAQSLYEKIRREDSEAAQNEAVL